jgi:methylmalonyl-CoA/ethylmalonyl-CoA epimerase
MNQGAFVFDHVGVVVPTLGEGRDHLSALLGVDRWSDGFEDPAIEVFVQFGRDRSGVVYELVAPRGETSPIARALKTGQRILNHVAYLTSDFDASAAHFRECGCLPAGPATPAVAYGGRPVQFFVSPMRFIVEIIDAIDHRHAFAFGSDMKSI